MLLKIKFKKAALIFFINFFLINVSVFAQKNITAEKKAEHDAVKDYFMKHYPESDFTKNINYLSDKKNEGNADSKLSKTNAYRDRKSLFMNGNKISTDIYNYGGIAPGFGLLRGVNNFVWRNQSYVFQFGPLVGASVPDSKIPGKQLHIISDGLNDYSSPLLQEVSPNRDTLWQWEPIEGYFDPASQYMASNPAPDNDGDGKPDSWPRTWYNPNLGRYVWPGYLSQDATNADLEAFWGMDDRDNSEFPYYPFLNDNSRRGLGVQVEGRAFQWSNALAENTIFFVYTITNVSDKDLDSVFFGIYGDPDLGGGSPENTDDNGFFVPPYNYDGNHDVSKVPVYSRSMVYFWDPDMKGTLGMPLGYLGCKFLESPGNSENGIDDDGDGIIDERQDDGIDNDGDWNALTDDLGIDGIANTGDQGEGDGVPTPGVKLSDGSLDPLNPGEPNFEFTDLDESDQIGLTSFNSWSWSTDKISNDESMWNRSKPQDFSEIQQNADIVFIFASGYISLKKGETKRISMALLCGEDLDDLLLSAETVQRIYNANYRFFKPPVKPKVTAVPGDKKVTLYWDSKAEESFDPITGNDFEGYVIYRSTDPSFGDIQTITDGKGSSFFSEPLKGIDGSEAKWDVAVRDEPYQDFNGNNKYDAGELFTDVNADGKWSSQIEDWWSGYSPVEYRGRGIKYFLGNNNGLVHSYVDSNNVINGQTYYYAVVAYDHGDSVGIPPTETTKKITVDPITSQLQFDENTVRIIPGPRASGYVPPASDFEIVHESGIGTGDVTLKMLNDLNIQEDGEYQIIFSDSLLHQGQKQPKINYSIIREAPHTENFNLFDTNFTKLDFSNIVKDEVLSVADAQGIKYNEGIDYVIDYARGLIRRTGASTMATSKTFTITYRYYPVFQSTYLNNEDGNAVFDGLSIKVNNDPVLEIDTAKTRWIQGNSDYNFVIKKGTIGAGALYPADYEITFSSDIIDSALILGSTGLKKIPVRYSVNDVTTKIPQPILTYLNENNITTKNEAWDPGEEIIFFKPGSVGTPTETTWGITILKPSDSTAVHNAPVEGDVLFIKTNRSFNKNDKFSFKTTGAKYNSEFAKSGMDNIYVVPNPYVGVNEIEPTIKLPGQTRGERRIYFENLPPKCTIRIFTLSGEFVQKIDHETNLSNGREYWNLLNRDGFGVAYGIYFAHIDAPGIGEKIVKFALIK